MSTLLKNILNDAASEFRSVREKVTFDNHIEAWRCYQLYRKNLLCISSWNKTTSFGQPNFKLHDSYGYLVSRPIQVGDFIQVNFSMSSKEFIFLEIHSIIYNHEADGQEDNISLLMKESQPGIKKGGIPSNPPVYLKLLLRRIDNYVKLELSNCDYNGTIIPLKRENIHKYLEWSQFFRNFLEKHI